MEINRSNRRRQRQQLLQSVRNILAQPEVFVQTLKIVGKDGRQTTLKFWPEQLDIFRALLNPNKRHTWVMKARQVGSSTVALSYLFYVWLTSPDPVNIIILSHRLDSSQNLISRFKYFYDTLPDFLKPELEYDSKTKLKIRSTGATVSIQSANQKGAARSFTATHVLVSEFAFAPDSDELKAVVLSALNDGELIVESTANHWGDGLHTEWCRMDVATQSYEQKLFFPWFTHNEYRVKDTNGIVPTPEERRLMVTHQLTVEQIAWRRENIAKFGWEKFRREYPASVDEAYRSSGKGLFEPQLVDSLKCVKSIRAQNYKPEYDSRRYTMGVDVGLGRGGDPTDIIIWDAKERFVVDRWTSKDTPVEQLADVVFDMAKKWNNSLVIIEANFVGSVLIDTLEKRRGLRLWKTDKGKDWSTTKESKIRLLTEVASYLRAGYLNGLDEDMRSQLRTFVLDDNELPVCKSDGTHHGDAIIALGLALIAARDVHLPMKQKIGPQKSSSNVISIGNRY